MSGPEGDLCKQTEILCHPEHPCHAERSEGPLQLADASNAPAFLLVCLDLLTPTSTMLPEFTPAPHNSGASKAINHGMHLDAESSPTRSTLGM